MDCLCNCKCILIFKILLFVYFQSGFQIQTTTLAVLCDKLCQEGKSTIGYAYKVFQMHSNSPRLHRNIFIFAHQVEARRPRITAAGFLNVDLTALFTFFNLITTYVIVIVQFAPQRVHI